MDKEEDVQGLANRIRQAMEWRGYTQGQLAEYSGIDQAYISMIVNGKRRPGFDKVVAIADALRVSLDWLADRATPKSDHLSPDEDELLRLYRSLPSQDQKVILGTARLQAEAKADD